MRLLLRYVVGFFRWIDSANAADIRGGGRRVVRNAKQQQRFRTRECDTLSFTFFSFSLFRRGEKRRGRDRRCLPAVPGDDGTGQEKKDSRQ